LEGYSCESVQAKLKDLIEIIDMVVLWAGSYVSAGTWFRTEPIPALGYITGESGLKQGQAQAVKEYIEGILLGGYA
jgi:hypothetical protein